MKKAIDALLLIAVIVPIVLLFFPFAEWNGAAALILRVIPSLSLQALLCRACGSKIVKAIPSVLSGVFAVWGTFLYFTSPHWREASVGDLFFDYVSPFICCIVVIVGFVLIREFEKKV